MADDDRTPVPGPDEERTEWLAPSNAAAETPERIGHYRILRAIGEGGMGVVYEAEQEEPVRRRVALKLIKWGMDTRSVVARFESERQALALMDHPGIATVFDGGATDTGRPYFVMEYVKGVPITQYCDTHRLGTRARLELFIGVCEAVQHAHQKGVIHRDLKASNVLVALQDDRPVPKVIDFGVAKAIAQRLTEHTVYTEFGQLIGTPEYMSPEQAEMSGLDIDTRSDVYSLGVMLYQLLTGALPFDPKELRKSGFDEIRRRIRQEDPSKPSTKISTIGEGSTDAAANRRTDPRSLIRQLRGDLDWITMKALDKDRTRRYPTALEMAADIGRHLEHQPVVAGPPTLAYRTRKFAMRHRVGVAVGALLVVLLGAFAVRERIHAHQVALERDTAQQVSEFLTGLFEVSDPKTAQGDETTVRELLDRGADRIETELADQPEVQARMMTTLGRIYQRLGHYEQAEGLLTAALEIRRRELGESHLDTLTSLDALATVYHAAGQLESAEECYRKALEGLRRTLGDDHPTTLSSVGNLGHLLLARGDLANAERYSREAVDGLGRVLDPDSPERIVPLANLAYALHVQGRLDEAEPYYREALALARQVLGDDHPDTLHVISAISFVLKDQGRLDEAEPYYLEVLERRRRVLGDDHPSTMTSMNNMGLLLRRQGKLDEAELYYREALAGYRRTVGNHHPDTLISIGNMGVLLKAQGRLEEAEPYYRESLEGHRQVLGDDHHNTMLSMSNYGVLLRSMGRLDEAERYTTQALEAQGRVLGDDHHDTLRSIHNLGELRRAQGRLDEADQLYRKALEGRRRSLGDQHPATRVSLQRLIELCEQRGLSNEAEQWRAVLAEIEASDSG